MTGLALEPKWVGNESETIYRSQMTWNNSPSGKPMRASVTMPRRPVKRASCTFRRLVLTTEEKDDVTLPENHEGGG